MYLATEELAKVSPSVAISFSAHVNLCIDNLVRNGNEEQKGRFLPGLCRGNLVDGMAITEPSAGSDALGMQTTATRSGSRYLLNGSKIFTTNAPIADIIIVYAKTDISRGARGITAFIVETGTTGFKVKRSLDKIGIRGAPSAEIGFDNCEVEAFNILIGENQGLQVMMNGLDFERAVLSSVWLGTAQGAFDLALKYSKERIQFGQAISNFQLIQAKLADMYTLIQASRLFVYWVVRRAEAGMNVSRDAAAANLMSGEMCVRVAEEAVQIHGGYGLLLENPVQRYYRDAKLATI
ncbi:MAG: acyl-CoA dehydrogenase family protein, partial [Syntrophomonadaceae bacterium]|nr:acyl-CoA dehydrogenase family protein [Syntrophomonadaceae bacterium]